ncbi:integrase [Pseudomonas taiwanensis]|uniref:tyrosine-type recombinase/integrase n=1 Tax=Pseudomonas taiwanensis TaxID=470150 RepID=UPI0015BAC397|nr:site-specific integrase [Pseudomonas taiwanensis]NWL80585.1 integrase [Pseudomonas taiwanensis]
MTTEYVNFSDAAIKRAAKDEDVRVLRDELYPELRLRFRDSRRLAAWDVLQDGKWKKAADWPRWSCSAMQAALPGVLASRAAGAQPAGRFGQLVTVNDLLRWYLDCQLGKSALSKARKASCRTVILKWLLPYLGGVWVEDLDRALVHRVLIQPIQGVLAPATVAKVYRVLVAAIHAAQKLRRLPRNPLEGVKFPEFGVGPIKPKPARLLPKDAGAVVERLAELFSDKPRDCMLPLLMLCTGSRIGETRQARWAEFDLDAGWWVIPSEHTKTRTQLEVPLTPELVELLHRYQATQVRKPSVFLFPGGQGKPLSEQAAQGIVRELSGGAFTSHDLRKMARAGWAQLGVDYLVAELLLNHAMPGLTSTYVQTDLSRLKREALELWQGVGNARAAGLHLAGRFRL